VGGSNVRGVNQLDIGHGVVLGAEGQHLLNAADAEAGHAIAAHYHRKGGQRQPLSSTSWLLMLTFNGIDELAR
jgi:hypothetical protein